jgi:tetrapyrrole methylase family protein/MazG family protein
VVTAPTDLKKIQSLVEILEALRGPQGCPWDKEQTHESLTQYLIEETHELVEAIEEASPDKDTRMKEELGDVLFQVLLHTQLASERGAFKLDDVIEGICKKMIRRHPHVFGDVKVSSSNEVHLNWEEIKKQERQLKGEFESTAYSIKVPPLPALQRAYKIGQQTKKLNFDWEDVDGVMLKVEEELDELREALDGPSRAEIEHELGDVLFSLAQLGRHLDMEPEKVLRKANERFEGRFKKMIEFCTADKKNWATLDTEAKEYYWDKAKEALKKTRSLQT